MISALRVSIFGSTFSKIVKYTLSVFIILLSSCDPGEEKKTTPSPPAVTDTAPVIPSDLPTPQAAQLFSPDPELGIKTSRTRLIVSLKSDATGKGVSDVITQVNGVIAGGITEARILFVDIPDPGDLTGIQTTINLLLGDPNIAAVSEDVMLSVTSRADEVIAEMDQWVWSDSKIEGNWGQKFSRFPSLWNVFDKNADGILQKSEISNVPASLAIHRTIGVLDTDFQVHPDLPEEILEIDDGGISNSEAVTDDHGNHVSGIIAASFNGSGINGVNPIVKLVGLSYNFRRENFVCPPSIECIERTWSEVLIALDTLLKRHNDIKVVNISLGYNWWPNYNIDPNKSAKAQTIVARQSATASGIVNGYPNTLFVSAAGNDSDFENGRNVDAKWSSPLNHASALAPNIVVVSATNRLGEKANFSNSGSVVTVGAPGVCILSTVLPQIPTSPAEECPNSQLREYQFYSGTSMAAPMVSGLSSMLISLDQNLTINQIKTFLTKSERFYEDPITKLKAPILDAFSASMQSVTIIRKIADINSDSKIDLIDLSLLESAIGTDGYRREDLNGDGTVNALDHSIIHDLLSSADFNISINPSSQAVTAGNSAPYTVSLTSLNSFNSAVSFSCSGLPSGANCSFDPSSIIPPNSTTMRINTVSSTTTGSFSITVTATGNGISHTASVNLRVDSSTPVVRTLTLNISGSGAVNLSRTSREGTTSCSAPCAPTYDNGTSVTLSANPASGFTFNGWGGDCSGTSSFSISMTSNKSCTATFAQTAPQTFTLTIGKSGSGNGIVNGPAGISCGGVCSGSFASGSQITLTADPSSGSIFGGFSGECVTSSSSCTFTMPARNTTVTGTFNSSTVSTRTLSITINGIGTINLSTASREGTTSCSSTCTLTYNDNTTVTLTASPAGLPASGTIFSRWDGCSNTSGATCTVTVTADASVTANFSCFEVEPNGGSPSGTLLANGKPCLGVISTSLDFDWFRIGGVSSGTKIQFILAVPPGLDYELEIYGPSNNSSLGFLCASRKGAGVSEQIIFTTTAGGTFYARVFGANATHFNSTSLYAVAADFPVSGNTICGL